MKQVLTIVIVMVFSDLIFAQTGWTKWKGQEISYALPQLSAKKSTTVSASENLVSSAQKLYKNLFSNFDGDNCAFHPSCSSFFVQAVNKTNFVTGSLLFIDRFTRDLNFAKGLNNYPLYNDGHFDDPVKKYLNSSSD